MVRVWRAAGFAGLTEVREAQGPNAIQDTQTMEALRRLSYMKQPATARHTADRRVRVADPCALA